MRCVSYTRYVSAMPEKNVPADIIKIQNDRISKYARRNGWHISQKYSDRKNDKTAEAAFLQMKHDGMIRKFDMVIIDSFYRSGRNISVGKNLLAEIFYPAGIHFAVAEDDFCSIGKSPEELKQYFAKKYADYSIKLRWTATMDKRAEGYFNVHDERYGYLLSDDHRDLVIDEEAAVVIREVFQMTADGMTMSQIAEVLNERGYESPAIHLDRVSIKKRYMGTKGYWTANTVKTVSSCSQYLGKVTKKVGDDYIEYDIPKIIDTDLYNRAMAAKKQHYHGCPIIRAAFNPFKFIIRDRKTGEPLLCITNQEDRSIREFCIGRKNEDPTISFEEVYAAVMELLKKESIQARNVAAMLETEEAKSLYDERYLAIKRSLRRIMKNVSDVSEKRIKLNSVTDEAVINQVLAETDSRLQDLEQKYQRKLEDLADLKKAFTNNPWVGLYKDIYINEDFDDRQIRRLIETVWVRDFKYVTADMKLQEWRSMLPMSWRKGESVHGAKEQEEF